MVDEQVKEIILEEEPPVEIEVDELDQKHSDCSDISISTGLKAAFLGREKEAIIEYVKRCTLPRGCTLAHMELYFVGDIANGYGLMTRRSLLSRLKKLVKDKIIIKTYYKSFALYFYTYNKEYDKE